MAKVYKVDESWGIDYTVQGRRIRKIIGPNKKIAELALQKKLVEIAEGKHLDVRRNGKVRFSEFADEYEKLHLEPNYRSWRKAEKHNIDHLKNFFGNKYLHEIKIVDIERLKMGHAEQGAAPATVNKLLGCLKSMFNKAIEWEKFHGNNPVSKVKMLKADNQRTRYLEKEEIEKLLSNCPEHLKDIVGFAINTGMRKSEIFNLKWHDIDFNRGLIFLLKTKNNEMREVPMNEAVKSILFKVKKNPESPYVFSGKNGGAIVDVKRSFSTALKKAGISNFRFHDLRHTFASQLVMAGVDLNTVRELLGHKDIKMTLRYSHLSANHKIRAVKALDAINGRKPSDEAFFLEEQVEISSSYANI